jgi:transketolase
MNAGLRETAVEHFMEEVAAGTNLVVLVSDSTSTSKISPFQKKYPDRLVNVGIAEQNLVGAAAGMALGGMIPVTANATPFLVGRSNEQVKNDICYSDTNVKLIGLNPGFAYGSLGPTHHAIDDISIMRGFGRIEIFAPQDPRETRGILRYAIGRKGPVYIRLDSISVEDLPGTDADFTPGRLTLHRKGGDCAVLALGTAAHKALAAAETLSGEGIQAEVIGISSVRPVDREGLKELCSRYTRLITVEEHSVHGGIGSLMAECIAEEGTGSRLMRLGVPEGEFAPASPREAIRQKFGLDAAGIADKMRIMMRK